MEAIVVRKKHWGNKSLDVDEDAPADYPYLLRDGVPVIYLRNQPD